MRGTVFALVGAALLAACASPPPAPEPVPEPAPPVAEETPKFKNSTLKYLANRNLKPQPTRPLNVRSRCSHSDAIGTVTRLNLLVKEAEVKSFDAQVSMKGRGSCNFNMKDFAQDAKLPQVLLRHKQESNCTVRMWEQEHKVTIAFNSCPKSCEGKAFEYLWPVVVDARNGRCH
ncbi:hypothetical protein [Azonexus hydrophilus]|jgi:hypothetical protein|uniref:Uncharacterized protein n=1 Tax=Azonexus hydrophilus TaxID=418702 RepID=A0ABZ2XKE3_9RHOO|nr:hypothetical protein [Azonexus hydrophilus]